MLDKFFAKCLVKAVTLSFLAILLHSIMKYFPSADCSHDQAFVIQCSHDSVTIYFSKLPHEYLAAIHKDGARYLQRNPDRLPISLKRTRKYHMRDGKELAEVFKVLVHLFCHLSSGKGQIGYLFDHVENPLHSLVLSAIW